MKHLQISGNLGTLAVLIKIAERLPISNTKSLFFAELLTNYTPLLKDSVTHPETQKLIVSMAQLVRACVCVCVCVCEGACAEY